MRPAPLTPTRTVYFCIARIYENNTYKRHSRDRQTYRKRKELVWVYIGTKLDCFAETQRKYRYFKYCRLSIKENTVSHDVKCWRTSVKKHAPSVIMFLTNIRQLCAPVLRLSSLQSEWDRPAPEAEWRWPVPLRSIFSACCSCVDTKQLMEQVDTFATHLTPLIRIGMETNPKFSTTPAQTYTQHSIKSRISNARGGTRPVSSAKTSAVVRALLILPGDYSNSVWFKLGGRTDAQLLPRWLHVPLDIGLASILDMPNSLKKIDKLISCRKFPGPLADSASSLCSAFTD